MPKLSEREIEVLQSTANVQYREAVGKQLGISHHTVASHMRNIHEKTGTHSPMQAVVFALRAGLIK